MTSAHTLLGRKGEREALNYLKRSNYQILATNWRYNSKEIDIIATHHNTLVIIEVKTRESDAFQHPYEAVDHQKQKYLIEASEAFIEQFEIDMEVRFDIISVILQKNNSQIAHIKEAFYPFLD